MRRIQQPQVPVTGEPFAAFPQGQERFQFRFTPGPPEGRAKRQLLAGAQQLMQRLVIGKHLVGQDRVLQHRQRVLEEQLTEDRLRSIRIERQALIRFRAADGAFNF